MILPTEKNVECQQRFSKYGIEISLRFELHSQHIYQHMDALHWPCIPILEGTRTWCSAEH